jgi:hypothetical protein
VFWGRFAPWLGFRCVEMARLGIRSRIPAAPLAQSIYEKFYDCACGKRGYQPQGEREPVKRFLAHLE